MPYKVSNGTLSLYLLTIQNVYSVRVWHTDERGQTNIAYAVTVASSILAGYI